MTTPTRPTCLIIPLEEPPPQPPARTVRTAQKATQAAQKSKKRDLQKLLNEVVWYHGCQPDLWPPLVWEGLTAKGLPPESIDHDQLVRAQAVVTEELKRRVNTNDDNMEWEKDAYPTDYTREQLLARLKKKHPARQRQNACYNSRHRGNVAGTTPTQKEKSMTMITTQVRQSEFRAAMRVMKFPNADDSDKWNRSRFQKKVSSVDEWDALLNKAPSMPTDGSDEYVLLQNITDTLNEGGQVEVLDDETDADSAVAPASHETNGHADAPVTEPAAEAATKPGKKKGEKNMSTATATKPKATKDKSKKAAKAREPREPRVTKNSVVLDVLKKSGPRKQVSKEVIEEALKKYIGGAINVDWCVSNARQIARKGGGDILKDNKGYWLVPKVKED